MIGLNILMPTGYLRLLVGRGRGGRGERDEGRGEWLGLWYSMLMIKLVWSKGPPTVDTKFDWLDAIIRGVIQSTDRRRWMRRIQVELIDMRINFPICSRVLLLLLLLPVMAKSLMPKSIWTQAFIRSSIDNWLKGSIWVAIDRNLRWHIFCPFW